MNDFVHILPLLILAGFSVLILLVITLVRNYLLTMVLAAAAYITAFISILFTAGQQVEAFNLLIVDGLGIFFLAQA